MIAEDGDGYFGWAGSWLTAARLRAIRLGEQVFDARQGLLNDERREAWEARLDAV